MRYKTLTIRIIIALLLLCTTEVLLRYYGFRVGYHTNSRYFTPVDSLIEYNGFFTDENGIFKIDSTTGKIIEDRIKTGKILYNGEEGNEVYCLTNDYIYFIQGKIKNPLWDLYISLLKKSPSHLSSFEKSVIKYINSPINDNGFKSISFTACGHSKPSVLLLGDSFTWGHSTSNVTNSFADILLSKEYIVYNTGITGTDPAQYLAIAKKYISELHPDYVIVNFFVGNDVTYLKREVKPNRPIFYSTNAGILFSSPEGDFFPTALAAYHYIVKKWSIPSTESTFNMYMSQTVITSQIWKVMKLTGLFPFLDKENSLHDEEVRKRKKSMPYCNIELKEIEKICKENNSKFILSSIPEVYRWTEKKTQDFPGLFEGLNYVEMKTKKSDYVLSNAHFNDKGHAKYAVFLDSIIKAQKPIIEN